MNNLITVSGVKGYIDENGMAWLNTEAVARGLGFTQIKDGKEYVRWGRVNSYLSDMGFPQLVGKEFIPENVFYRLAMKGETENAKAFQVLVADEILPSIRKTGSYAPKQMTQAEILVGIAQVTVEIERKANTALDVANKASRQITNALDIFTAPIDKDWRQSTNAKMRGICQEYGLSYLVFYHDLYEELDNLARINLKARLTRLRTRLQAQGATKTACKTVTPEVKAYLRGNCAEISSKICEVIIYANKRTPRDYYCPAHFRLLGYFSGENLRVISN